MVNPDRVALANRADFRQMTFSFARPIQQPALDLWKGQDSNVEAAQQALLYGASCSRAARQGKL